LSQVRSVRVSRDFEGVEQYLPHLAQDAAVAGAFKSSWSLSSLLFLSTPPSPPTPVAAAAAVCE